MPTQLFGGKDDLNALGVIGLRDRMIEKADSSDDLTRWHQLVIGAVAWVTDDDWGLS